MLVMKLLCTEARAFAKPLAPEGCHWNNAKHFSSTCTADLSRAHSTLEISSVQVYGEKFVGFCGACKRQYSSPGLDAWV
jgi:hypothetical protein